MIKKDDIQYILDPSSKTCIKAAGIHSNPDNQDMFSEDFEKYNIALNSGKTNYNGKEYDFEEFDVDGAKIQYLFDGEELKVMKMNAVDTESVVEIVSMKKGVDKTLFEIPKDYNVVEY